MGGGKGVGGCVEVHERDRCAGTWGSFVGLVESGNMDTHSTKRQQSSRGGIIIPGFIFAYKTPECCRGSLVDYGGLFTFFFKKKNCA